MNLTRLSSLDERIGGPSKRFNRGKLQVSYVRKRKRDEGKKKKRIRSNRKKISEFKLSD